MNTASRDATPRPAADRSFTLGELETYWQQTHRQIADEQGAAGAIVETHPWLVTQFDDFAHRLGMRALFRRMGNLQGRRVLDMGCGRGRWVEQFSRRGARVTGIDWSEEALEQARRRVPQAEFMRMPVTSLDFAESSFDVVNCFTVVQHLPYEVQAGVIRQAARVLVSGGWFSLVELTAPQAGPHVFPRRAEDWVALARECGFTLAGARGCCYELAFRPYKALMNLLRVSAGNSGSAAGVGARRGITGKQRANRLLMAALALPAFPLELLSLPFPVGMATHAAMLFRRGEDSDRL